MNIMKFLVEAGPVVSLYLVCILVPSTRLGTHEWTY